MPVGGSKKVINNFEDMPVGSGKKMNFDDVPIKGGGGAYSMPFDEMPLPVGKGNKILIDLDEKPLPGDKKSQTVKRKTAAERKEKIEE